MPNRLKKYLQLVWLVFTLALVSQGSEAQTVAELLSKANDLFKQGMTDEARQIHESIVRTDTSCLESTVWLGNYYFLRGEEKRHEAERAYKTIPYPSSMQSAFYQEQLKNIFREYYLKSETFVQRALRARPNEHLQLMETDIEALKIKLGLAKPSMGKKSPIVRLIRSIRDSTKLP